MAENDLELSAEEKAADEAAMAAPEVEEEPVAPEPEAEAAEEAEAKPEDGEKDKRFVPLDALHSERGKRRDAEARVAEMEAQLRQIQPVLQAWQQLQGNPQAAQKPEEMPDPVINPAEFKTWLDRQMTRTAEPVTKYQQQVAQQQEQARQIAALKHYAAEHEAAFRQQHADKDYDGALEFARERKMAEFQLYGYSEQESRQLVAHAEAQTTALAQQRGVNPAALVYNWAVLNGYQPKAPQPSNVARLADVQRRTQTLGTSTGAPRDDEYTVERLAAMSEDEIAKLPEDVLRKAMGG